MLQRPVIIIEAHQQFRLIYLIHPLGDVLNLIIRTFSGNGIANHHIAYRNAAKKANIKFLYRANPERGALIVNFKEKLFCKNIGRVTETQVAVDIAVQILALGVLDAVRQLHAFRILGRHINFNIGRDAFALVGQPLNAACIDKGGDAHRLVVHINLAVIIGYLKLGHHVHHAAHFPVAQKGGGILVENGDGIIVHLGNIRCKIMLFHRHKLLVLLGVYNRGRSNGANQENQQQDTGSRKTYLGDNACFDLYLNMAWLQFNLLTFSEGSPQEGQDAQGSHGANEKPPSTNRMPKAAAALK